MTKTEFERLLDTPQALRLQDCSGDGLAIGYVFGSRVVVSPVKPETSIDRLEKAGTLYAPTEAKERLTPRPSTGIVVALGTLAEGLKIGDAVLFNRHAASHHLINGREVAVMDATDVYCSLVAAGEETAI